MNISNLKNSLFEKADKRGFSDWEIFYSDNSSFKVSVYKGKIEKYQNSQSGGFCFRGIYNGKMGYYFSENIENVNTDAVVENAALNAEILAGEDEEFIFKGSEKYTELNTFSEEIENMSPDEKISAAFEMERFATEFDDRISVNSSIVATGKNETYIANSKGLELRDKSNYIMAYVEAMASDGGETKEKGELWLGTDLSGFEPKKIATKAGEKVISALGGKAVESGSKNIIIENEVFADILECFCGNFFAENVQKGFSLLKNKIGEKIANDNITIIDNPHLKGGYSTTSFDSEGVATFSKNVVEKGVLKTYLYNLKSGAKDNVESTGNGFKAGFKGSVNTSTTNFYIEKGTMSLEDMAIKVENGLLITDVAGLHSGTNAISGDFSVAAEGFKIENGKITSPVNQITIASNFYEVLMSIDSVGNDLKFNSSAIGSPSVIVNNINVAGL